MSTSRFAAAGHRPLAPETESYGRSILIGVVGTVLFHVLLIVLSPRFALDDFSGVHTGIEVGSAPRGQTFDFELAQPEVTEVQQRKPFNFVETNSAAPENLPDETENFSNRNQQAAQEVAALELDPQKRPSTKGEDKFKDTTAIVSGDMAPPQLAPPPTPEEATEDQQQRTEQLARMEQVPLAGFDKTEGTDADGIATNVADSKKASTHAAEAVDGSKDSTAAQGGLVAVTAQNAKTQPKERKRLASASLNRQSPLANRVTGVSNMGVTASDAFQSEYGEYLNELIEIVQIQWYRILAESRVSPPRGSHVAITFTINSKGETDIVKVEDEGSGRQGVFSCQNAIQARQPYRKWSDEMIALLGEQQSLTFRFYHQ
ncbi:hypothetical protein Verru16b_02906 [Lacunisphaera limnophila]|uniref:Uncharacterized protein n=1 Tax=Lacunisphaera limnophila TaxID=1838286 RepID=A0A1D8AY61_9BACT|nr:hypothetical protein [Lacunisphaera limnophila]AOS45817.1 hypothetical protein Verru16b_02906 [Lacunisphaera limnophila]